MSRKLSNIPPLIKGGEVNEQISRLQRLLASSDEVDELKIDIDKKSSELAEIQIENSYLKKQYEKMIEIEEENRSLRQEMEILQRKVDLLKDYEDSAILLDKPATSNSYFFSSATKLNDFDRYVQNFVTSPLPIASSSENDGILDEEMFTINSLPDNQSSSAMCNFKGSVVKKQEKTSTSEDEDIVDDGVLRDANLFSKIPLFSGFIKGSIYSKIKALKTEQTSLKKEMKTKVNEVYSSIIRDSNDVKTYEEKQLAISRFFSGKEPGTCNYVIPKVNEKERKNLCGINEYKKQHKFVAHYLSPRSNARGILAWHSLGSGKTSIAVLTCAHHLREYYVLGNENARVIVFIVKKELIPNFSSEFRKYIPYEYVFGEVEPTDVQTKNERIERVFRDRIFVTTYHDLCASLMGRKQWNNVPLEIARGLGIRNGQYIADSKEKRILENTLLIIDEAHNLVRPEKCDRGTFGQSTDYTIIADPFILKNCVQQTSDIKILLMTATPVTERLSEFGILVNFMKHRVQDKDFMFPEVGDPLRVPKVPIPPEATRPNLKKTEEAFQRKFFEEGSMKNQDVFLQCIAGWVSYFENTKDFNYYPSQRTQEVVTVMSESHRAFYEKEKKEKIQSKKTLKDIGMLRLEFTKLVTATRDAKSSTKVVTISENSTKLLAVLENIKIGASNSSTIPHPDGKPQFGKQLVFTPFPSDERHRIFSSIAITKILEATTEFGKWKKLEVKHLIDLQRFMKVRLGKSETSFPEIGEKIFEIFHENEFTTYIDKLRGGDTTVRFMVDLNALAAGSQPVPPGIKDMVKELFNSTWNMEGEYINLLLFNKKFSEGISYFNVRTVHVVGQPLSLLDKDQAIGRAIRYCSHRRLDIDSDKWNVTVFNYVMVFSEDEKQRYLSGSMDWITPSFSEQSGGVVTTRSSSKKTKTVKDPSKPKADTRKTRKQKFSSTEPSSCSNEEKELRLCHNGTPVSPDIVMQVVAKEEADKFRTFLELAKVGAVDCPLYHSINDLPTDANGSPLPCFKPFTKGKSMKNASSMGSDVSNDDDSEDNDSYDQEVSCDSITKEDKCNNRDYCTWAKNGNFLTSALVGSKCVPVDLDTPKKCENIKSPLHCQHQSVCRVNKKKQTCEPIINESWFGKEHFAITFEGDTNLVVPFSFPSENDTVSLLNRIATMLKSKKSIYFQDEEGAMAFGTDLLSLMNATLFKFEFFRKETVALQNEVSKAIYEVMSQSPSSSSNLFQNEFVRRSMFKFAFYYNQRLQRQVLKPRFFELETKLYNRDTHQRYFEVQLNDRRELHYYVKISIYGETSEDTVYYIDSDVSNASILFDEAMDSKEDFTITKECRAFPLYPLFHRSATSFLKCLVTFHIISIVDDTVTLSFVKLSVVSKKERSV
jgi:hypothetical protein